MGITVAPVGKEPLYGKRLTLKAISSSHATFLKNCYNDDGFMNRYRLAQERTESIEEIQKRLEEIQNYSPLQLRHIEWVIEKRGSNSDGGDKLIGLASLADYQPCHNRAEFLIGILDPNERNNSGIALEAALLVLEFAFQKAHIHKVTTFIYAYNKEAQKNILHLGFHQEALLREHYFDSRSEKFIDLYQSGLLRSDFLSSDQLGRWSKRLLGRDITDEEGLNRGVKKVMLNAELVSSIKKGLTG